jgi:hypothetical protein
VTEGEISGTEGQLRNPQVGDELSQQPPGPVEAGEIVDGRAPDKHNTMSLADKANNKAEEHKSKGQRGHLLPLVGQRAPHRRADATVGGAAYAPTDAVKSTVAPLPLLDALGGWCPTAWFVSVIGSAGGVCAFWMGRERTWVRVQLNCRGADAGTRFGRPGDGHPVCADQRATAHPGVDPRRLRTASRARLTAAARSRKSASTRAVPRTRARRPPCLRRTRWPSLRSTLGRVAR